MFKLYRIKHAKFFSYISNFNKSYLAVGLTIFIMSILLICPAISFAVLGDEGANGTDNAETSINDTNSTTANADTDYLCIENKGSSSQNFQITLGSGLTPANFDLSFDKQT